MTDDKRWEFRDSGMSPAKSRRWFHFKEIGTASLFVVNVDMFIPWERAKAIANEVADTEDVRRQARQLTEIGRDHRFCWVLDDDDDDDEPVTVCVWRMR